MRGGVLAIGSLYWCDHPSRARWRSSQLSHAEEKSVLVPIRYGRRSRGNTYTMVFSLLCLRGSHGLGVGKAIPFLADITTSAALIKEAELMWAAERKAASPDGSLSATWGGVALLTNPNRDLTGPILETWSDRVAKEINYGRISHTQSEPSVVSNDGYLRIPWPETTEREPLDLDFLLATATDPFLSGKPPMYPRTRDVALAWKRARNADYFLRNRGSGIWTYQDEAIQNWLSE